MSGAGISGIGLATGSHRMGLGELAVLRGVDPAKYSAGLGCVEMSLCGAGEGVAELAVRAAREALAMWGGDPSRLGLLIVGSETAADMSRPLSAWVAEALGLRGAFRSYEVKHACYGGTAAVRQAVEWVASGAARGKAALVIAADVALYAPGDPGEPTQGAGAVALVIEAEPRLAGIELASYAYSTPVFDFWRPVGEAFPRVDGPFSLECYKEAALACFGAWLEEEGPGALDTLGALCFHVPFPKMVQKAWAHVAERLAFSEPAARFAAQVEPHMAWCRRTGNSYTASAWFTLAHALAARPAGDRIGLFSYGSGAGAELLLLNVLQPLPAAWAEQVEATLDARAPVDAAGYLTLRTPPGA